MKPEQRPSRREFLKLACFGSFTVALANCTGGLPDRGLSLPIQPQPPETPTIEGLHFTECSVEPIGAHEYAINAATTGQDVGVTLRVHYKLLDSQDWTYLYELGVPRFTPENRPVWYTADLPPGDYDILVEAKTGNQWDNAVRCEIRVTLGE